MTKKKGQGADTDWEDREASRTPIHSDLASFLNKVEGNLLASFYNGCHFSIILSWPLISIDIWSNFNHYSSFLISSSLPNSLPHSLVCFFSLILRERTDPTAGSIESAHQTASKVTLVNKKLTMNWLAVCFLWSIKKKISRCRLSIGIFLPGVLTLCGQRSHGNYHKSRGLAV